MARRISKRGKAAKTAKKRRRGAGSAVSSSARLKKRAHEPTELAEVRRQLAEAHEQQTATSEVLKIISSSPGDLQPVFKAMLANAVRICKAKFGTLFLVEDGKLRAAALHNLPTKLAEFERKRGDVVPRPNTVQWTVINTKAAVHVPSLEASKDLWSPATELGAAKAYLGIPMLKDGEVIGTFGIYRQEPRPFTDKQIKLLQDFAAQAVIAIENTRLLAELRGALQQQIATADVLKVISRSTFNLNTVLTTLVESAARLCEADIGNIARRTPEGDFQIEANFGQSPELHQALARTPIRAGKGSVIGRTALLRQTVHILDAQDDPDYEMKEALRIGDYHTMVGVPLMREGNLVGVFGLARRTIRPFSERQIELVTTFADQAVIAIENVRLFDEVRKRTEDLIESLEQQTATSEVLGVISKSPGNLQPVFQIMLENACRICEAKFGVLFDHNEQGALPVAWVNLPIPFEEYLRQRERRNPRPGSDLDQLITSKQIVHTADMLISHAFVPSALLGGARTELAVPMLNDNKMIGAISIYRQEVKPFTEKQIELVQNFAAQAVIAIENARLLNELRQRTDDLTESLEQQTATSEVLKVISSSPESLEAAFETMLGNATRLCGAQFGTLSLYEGDRYHNVALHNVPPGYAALRLREPFKPHPKSGLARVAATKQFMQIDDLRTQPPYREGDAAVVAIADLAGARTIAIVPMVNEGNLVGAITIFRQEVKPFTAKQIQLVQNFAAQAVIAIENTRLLNELRESLQQQTATADVLKLISRSAFDLVTVLDALLKSAARLCVADQGTITQRKGDKFYRSITYGFSEEFLQYVKDQPVEAARNTGTGRALLEGKVVHIPDVNADTDFDWPEAQKLGNFRTMLGVPMLREGVPVGVLTLTRTDVRPFTDKQIELVSTFADQAAIAIENVRLFEELQGQKRELTEALEHQTATSEVLSVISRSPTNAQPVFEAIAESASRLCEAVFTVVWLYDGNLLHYVSSHNFTPEVLDRIKKMFPKPPDRSLAAGRAILDVTIAHVPDMLGDPGYAHELAIAGNWRASVAVPMLRDGKPVGAISVGKAEAGPFTERQMQLLTTFADQAVIAIENARLLNELRQSLQQQTATADVLKIISRSTFDLQVVLDTLTESAASLCEADMAAIVRERGTAHYWATSYGFSPELSEYVKTIPIERGRGSVVGRILMEGKTVHVADALADPNYVYVEVQKKLGYRAMLGVPLLREGVPIGIVLLMRRTVLPFTDKQIELATTFADQAVIAIENVRLFESVEARTRELAQSIEDLQTAQDRLVQTQKLASLGQLTAGIAHEIKNPLNFVNNFSSLSTELLDELEDAVKQGQFDEKVRSEIDELTETLRANLEKIEHHGKRADSIVKNMLLHSREGSGDHRPVDINSVIEESLNLAYHGARAEKQGFNITLERSLDPAAGEVDVFPQEITRVLLNVIANGFYAATKRKAGMGDGGAFEPALAVATKNLGDRVEIRIRDNGTGIPHEVKEKIFNPFFTTKPPGEGTGLGLSLSHDIIVKQHAGSIEVDTEPGQFTEIRIILPRTAATIAKTGGRA